MQKDQVMPGQTDAGLPHTHKPDNGEGATEKKPAFEERDRRAQRDVETDETPLDKDDAAVEIAPSPRGEPDSRKE
jgi:hypothetical protein